ncbi:nuclear transport factor 2 family protein [Kitasatospora viridis]|uniref:SnoaL-like domain-containing protein n=1 Tax=Kitasatospora viridis TaxID=281105 RepID=A0A561UDS6_9ACTN|nr:nuclear transport factor 2 family protein [Kitasatospora viridis]TWF97485.1 hypothetical protein FHX73_111265 [Kitasatospora viridis]
MTAGPVEIFERFRAGLAAGEPGLPEDLWAEDAVVEYPFAPDDRAQRFTGRAGYAEFAAAGRAARPAGVAEVRALHRTADPEVLIAEYEVGGAVFVLMLRVRDGLVRHWREYQDVAVPA